MDTSDEQLLRLIYSQRDEEAFRILYERHSKGLLQYMGSRIQPPCASEDILHDIYMELWEKGEEVERKCNDNLKKWLFLRAKSLVSGQLKKDHRMVPMDNITDKDELEIAVGNILDDIDYQELVELIDKVVKKMPFHLQQVYQLRVRHHYSVEQTAKLLSLSENTVYTRTSEIANEVRKKINIDLTTGAYPIFSIGCILAQLLFSSPTM